MKNSGSYFFSNAYVRFSKYLVLLLILAGLFAPVPLHADTRNIGTIPGNKKKKIQIKRTFVAPAKTVRQNGAAGQPPGATVVNPPVVTYADLNFAYSVQNGLYYYNQIAGTPSMNIGTLNKVTPQQWTMPNCNFDQIDTAYGIPVSQTPFQSYFPTASHCKLYEYPENGVTYSFFEYYNLNNTSVTLLGNVDDFNLTPNVVNDSWLIAPLPIDINFHMVVNDTVITDNQTKIYNEVINAEGFGTLTTTWGSMEVLKLVNHYNELIYENGVLVDEYHQPVVTFISKNGNQLELELPPGSATTGTVATEYIEYTRIVYDSFASVNNVTLGSGNSRCDDAFQTITVGGGGGPFTVNAGGSANMISGHNIKYLPGTKVKPGGRMRGYIAANGPYCPINYTYSNPWNRNPDSGNGDLIPMTNGGKTGKLLVFPNPASGMITLRMPDNNESLMVKVELTDTDGKNRMSTDLFGQTQYNLSLDNLAPGIYFLHATTGEWRETVKVVKW